MSGLSQRVARRLPGKLTGRVERPEVVAVVRLHGVIMPGTQPVPRTVLNLQFVEKTLGRAFAHERLAAVALVINSPGGSPTQSALIADRIRSLAEDKKVPVLVFCEDVAASGGYWLACAGDEIYAHPTSLVGSIGVVSHGFGLAGLLERLGVERRLYTAGANKARLDPFLPASDADVHWLRSMQDKLHVHFQDWVRQRRGAKLTGSDEDLFSGEVWTGDQAVGLGLIDGLGTPREVLSRKFPKAGLALVEGRRPLLARLGFSGPAAGFGAGLAALRANSAFDVLDAVEQRAWWSRYGL